LFAFQKGNAVKVTLKPFLTVRLNNLITCLILVMLASTAFADFGAYYTKINSGQEFERYSRTGPYADIVVNLNDGKFVFWRGSSYLPYWETDKGKWYVDELIRRKGDGPAERPDKVNTYSRVIIAENSPDKAVICWRYLPQFGGTNPHKGVDAALFVEETYTIRADGFVSRSMKQGTPGIDSWLDPLNQTVETFVLTRNSIEDRKLRQPAVSPPPAEVQGNPIRQGYVIKPVRTWSFDEAKGDMAIEQFTNSKCEIAGHKSLWKKGISGTALQFDGYTSSVILPASQAPKVTEALTLEAWVAIGAYPWNWTPIVQQCDDVPEELPAGKGQETSNQVGPKKEDDKGYFLGIDGLGQPGLKVKVGDSWEELVCERCLERRQWYHIAGTYDKEAGAMSFFIDGKLAGRKTVAKADIVLSNKDIKIGKGKPRRPITPVRASTFIDDYSFDGLIDEVRIYDVALNSRQIRQSYYRFKPVYNIVENPDMNQRVLPVGDNRGKFGAYYTNLKFYETWDNMWRFGDYPDVVVEFDASPAKFIFWRGTGYIPMLANEKGYWYSNEFNETWGKSGGQGCQEPMSDKESYTNHVRILENTPARVVLQWRYPLIDVRHVIANFNDETGWGDWSDWYYTIYPDGVAVKTMHLWTNGQRNHEWQESMAILGPDQHPEQVLEIEPALLLADLEGRVNAYNWIDGPPAKIDYNNKKIHVVNYRADYDPYTVADIAGGDVYGGEVTDYAVFPSWNHWPVAQMPSDGRYASFPDRTSHCSLTHIKMPVYKEALGDKPFYEKLMLEGMSNKSPAALAPLARSWLYPAKIQDVSGVTDAEYDQAQRAYVLTASGGKISFELAASPKSPVVNPCFVIKRWKDHAEAQVTVNGTVFGCGPGLRQGTAFDTNGDLMKIIWLQMEAEKTIKLEIGKD
jgi:hypothetical protein